MGSNKISIQLRTDNVSYWADRLQENWKVRGPVLRPWGSQYLYLLDPDGITHLSGGTRLGVDVSYGSVQLQYAWRITGYRVD